MANEIGLYRHNAKAYEKAKNNLKSNDRTCIVHATGTGKSFIALQVMYDFIKNNPGKKIIYLTPLSGIKEQVKEHINKIERDNKEKGIEFHRKYFDNVEFLNYQALITKSEAELKALEADLLITDEFHHIGAPEWTRAIDVLIESHPNIKIFGMSATRVRERGTANEQDVVKTFFNGNIASEYPLEEAISDGVLPAPNYHATLVFLEDECRELEEKVKEGNSSKEEKEEYKKVLKNIKKKIASMGEKTVQDIINEYIKRDGKYIYFCPQGVDIKEIQNNFLEMFTEEERKNIEFYTVHSSKYTSKENETMSNNFYHNITSDGKDAKGKLRIMFAINMYNEGIHVPDIDGVIMGRNTESDIIFYQQLGRALAVKKKDDNDESIIESPLVIDLQDNFRKILKLYKEVKRKITEKENYYQNETSVKDKRELFYTFGIDDEIINIVEELDNVKARLNFKLTFEEKMKEFLEYIRNNPIPSKTNKTVTFNDNVPMGSWWNVNKKKVYEMQEENKVAKEIVVIILKKEPNYFLEKLTFEEKMKEFLEYIKKNEIPTDDSPACFSDGTKMGYWWSDNKKIIYNLQAESEIAKQIIEIYNKKRRLNKKEKKQKFLAYIKENSVPTQKDGALFSDGTQMYEWWRGNKKMISQSQYEDELARQIMDVVNSQLPSLEKK